MEVMRQEVHRRNVECRGFRRSDGLWDIEGRLLDQKTYELDLGDRGLLAPGEPIHQMMLRLTIDRDMLIREVEATMTSTPYAICPAAAGIMQLLIGLRIGSGWLAEVRQRLPRDERCTHLFELLPPLATAAWQTLGSERPKPADNPAKLGTCYAYAPERLALRQR